MDYRSTIIFLDYICNEFENTLQEIEKFKKELEENYKGDDENDFKF